MSDRVVVDPAELHLLPAVHRSAPLLASVDHHEYEHREEEHSAEHGEDHEGVLVVAHSKVEVERASGGFACSLASLYGCLRTNALFAVKVVEQTRSCSAFPVTRVLGINFDKEGNGLELFGAFAA